MDNNYCEADEDPSGEACLTVGPWSQRSISRSLHRAEVLLRSTFHPSLKWLFRSHSQDEEEDHFVAAHNLVSRSSTRLLRLQQVLLTVAPQGQLVGETQTGSSQGHCIALWKLVLQRSLLLFTHEYTRRVRLAAAYISRVDHLLNHLKKAHLTLSQTLSMLSSLATNLSSLCQELRIHLNHWSCLFSRVQSDTCLRLALHQTRLLKEIRPNLDSLSLQALVLMEHCVYFILSAVAHMDLDSVPSKVLEDILTGTDMYNQAVEEQRTQQSAFQLRTAVLQQANCHRSAFHLTKTKILHPSSFSVHELLRILAVHHADMAARQLHQWVSEQSCDTCHKACMVRLGCGVSSHRADVSWEQQDFLFLSPMYSISNLSLQSSLCQTCTEAHSFRLSNLHSDCSTLKKCSVFATPTSIQQTERGDQTHQCLADTCQCLLSSSSVEVPHPLQQQRKTSAPLPSTGCQVSALPHSQVCRVEQLSVEILFQLLISSIERSSHRCTTEVPPELYATNTADALSCKCHVKNMTDSVDLIGVSSKLKNDETVQRKKQEGAETEAAGSECEDSSCFQEPVVVGRAAEEAGCARWPHSVQWSDLGQPLVLGDLIYQYGSLLRSLCREALRLQLFIPPAGGSADTINFQDFHSAFKTLSWISHAPNTGQVSEECKAMLVDFSEYLLVITAHAYWDHVLCRSLGSTLKDKCLTDQGRKLLMSSLEQDGSETTSTMRHFLLLPPPLHSALSCHQSDRRASGPIGPLYSTLRRHTVSLVLAFVQLSTVWVMSKAHQFLSSWSLNKFLLITQGDLKMLKKSLQLLMHQKRSLVLTSDDHCPSQQNHTQQLLRQQLGELDCSVSELQTFSSRVLKSFSSDCKRMSGEIFERTMPTAVHWRPGHRTGFPNSPSEYASLAAQAVIGQVLEGVAPLPDDARVQALSITMTAFMEAWMEHILKQKIKFSVQGALQLKQDFDCIREMIQADRYGLSADLHQHLLSLRYLHPVYNHNMLQYCKAPFYYFCSVFQQVDSAVVCLLQQPQAKSYLHSRAWEPLTHCCPSAASRESLDAAVNSSITNLNCVEGAELTADLPAVAPSTPAEPYLAPSVSLGASQQQWLDLRIQNNARRWRFPGLQCLSTYES